MNKASFYGISVLGVLVLTRCGSTTEPPPGTGGASGASGSIAGAGGSSSAGSTASGGGTSSGFGGFAGVPGTGGAANTGGFAGTLGLGGATGTGGVPGGGVVPDAGVRIPPGGFDAGIGFPPGAFDAGIGNFNFDAAAFAFDAAGFRGFDGGAVACPANQPNQGGFCFTANQSCPYTAVTCTCEAPDGGGLPLNTWNCQ
jgi:hypothetical protein